MTVNFYKYQGTGNDFILIDNRTLRLDKHQTKLVKRLCDRRFGIGADGLILLQDKKPYDFEMVYFNSDGNESSMCGNGGRCLVSFAHDIGLIKSTCRFVAIDGEHDGEILHDGRIKLKMKDVDVVEELNSDFVLNTGSPHYVRFLSELISGSINEDAKSIRYSERFRKEGINVNFVVEKERGGIYVRTYERGVEDETLSCGTGVVASAIAYSLKSGNNLQQVNIETPGGKLEVSFHKSNNGFKNIYLTGPAEKVFEGVVEV